MWDILGNDVGPRPKFLSRLSLLNPQPPQAPKVLSYVSRILRSVYRVANIIIYHMILVREAKLAIDDHLS
jgi:hypothetical protein